MEQSETLDELAKLFDREFAQRGMGFVKAKDLSDILIGAMKREGWKIERVEQGELSL